MRTVIVTGAQQGIGKTIAENFAKLNWNVIIVDKDSKAKLMAVKKELEQNYNAKVTAFYGDVSNEQFVETMFSEVAQSGCDLQAVINNAAIVEDLELKDRSAALFNQTLTNNVTSVFLMSKIFGHYMLKNKCGRIVNISSTNGDQTLYPTSVDYDASKAAINNLTKNFAIELAPYVNVNAVMPGWVMTEMNAQLDKNFLAQEKKKMLLKKFQTTQDIANAVEFLVSEKSASITGAIIPVDGGLSIRH